MTIRYSNADPSSNVRISKKKYAGNYLGIVVQNNDPMKMGRVKVFVPHISPGVYKNWIDQKTDLAFKFPGKNIDSDLSKIINPLKEILPWADCAAPLVGASGSGKYNAFLDQASISDSNKLATTAPNLAAIPTKYSLNKEGVGEKPSRKLEVQPLQVSDAFNDTSAVGSNRVNKFSQSYIPSSYSNIAKGSFAVPNVGSHVWVFFQSEDPMYPVYFAVAFGEADWQGIYDMSTITEDGVDYPGSYENRSAADVSSFNQNSETYRNKFVLSQKGGTVEIVNTDNRELLKMTHYSGSFLEFNNHTTTRLATGNDQSLILADQFSTVRGYRSEYVENDYELLIKGDFYRKVGTLNYAAFQQWKAIADQIGELKQLFEIKRANFDQGSLYIKKQSPGQLKSPIGTGGHSLCPVCSHPNRAKYWNTRYKLGSVADSLISSIFSNENQPSKYYWVTPRFTGNIPSFVLPPVAPSNFLGGGNCPCCGGSGISPSTQGGTFDTQNKDTLITATLREKISQLAQIEQQLGLGGSEVTQITKHKIETIGLIMNDLPAIRVDPVGKINNNSVIVLPSGVVTNQTPTPLIELVHVDDLPGGSYNLNVCNRWNVLVGSGGLSLKTYGLVEIGGAIANIAAEQINIVSENEVNIVGDQRLTLTSNSIVLRHKGYGQVLVDSNLGVSQNVVIGGSLHVEGELSVQHITAPAEVQETQLVELVGWIDDTEIYSKLRDNNGKPCFVAGSGQLKVTFIPHSHQFLNVPLNLTKTADGTRKIGAQQTSKTIKMPALPVVNAKKVAQDPS